MDGWEDGMFVWALMALSVCRSAGVFAQCILRIVCGAVGKDCIAMVCTVDYNAIAR